MTCPQKRAKFGLIARLHHHVLSLSASRLALFLRRLHLSLASRLQRRLEAFARFRVPAGDRAHEAVPFLGRVLYRLDAGGFSRLARILESLTQAGNVLCRCHGRFLRNRVEPRPRTSTEILAMWFLPS